MKAFGQILVLKTSSLLLFRHCNSYLCPFIATVSYGNITAFVINLNCFLSVFTNISVSLGSGYAQCVDIQLSWQNDGSFRPWNLASWICLDRLKSSVSSCSYKWRWEKGISFHTWFSWVLSRWYDQYQAKEPNIFQVCFVLILMINNSQYEATHSQPSNTLLLLAFKNTSSGKIFWLLLRWRSKILISLSLD